MSIKIEYESDEELRVLMKELAIYIRNQVSLKYKNDSDYIKISKAASIFMSMCLFNFQSLKEILSEESYATVLNSFMDRLVGLK